METSSAVKGQREDRRRKGADRCLGDRLASVQLEFASDWSQPNWRQKHGRSRFAAGAIRRITHVEPPIAHRLLSLYVGRKDEMTATFLPSLALSTPPRVVCLFYLFISSLLCRHSHCRRRRAIHCATQDPQAPNSQLRPRQGVIRRGERPG